MSRDSSWNHLKSSASNASVLSSSNSYGYEDSADQSGPSSRASLHVKKGSIGNAAGAKLRLSPVNIKLNAASSEQQQQQQQQYSPSLSSDSGSPSPISGSPLMSSASSVSSPHSSISWKARLRRSLSNQEKIQSPLSNVFNPDMAQSESGDGKSSAESLSLDAQASFVVAREKDYDMDPESPTGSGDDDDYLEEHQRTVTSTFLQGSLSDRPRFSIDSSGSGMDSRAGDTPTPRREQAADRFIPIVQPQSPQSDTTAIALSAPTRTSYGNSNHYYQHLPVHLQASSHGNAQGRQRQRELNRSIDSHKSSQEEQDSSPPTSPTAANVPSPYSGSSSTQPTEIPTARRSSSMASSPSSYQRHHSVYVLSGQMFKNSPQGSPKSHLTRVLASDQENYTTDSDSDCWGGKLMGRKKSTDRVFSDSDAEDESKQRRAPIKGFHLPPRMPLRLEYDSDNTAASANGQHAGKLDKLMSSPSLSAFGGNSLATSNSLPAFFPDLSANAPQNLVSQIGFMDDTNELNAASALIHEMVRAKTKSDTEIHIILDGWYECKRDKGTESQQEVLESYGSKWMDNDGNMGSPEQWEVIESLRDVSSSPFQTPADGYRGNWYETKIGPLDRVPSLKREGMTQKSSRHNSVSHTDSTSSWSAATRSIGSYDEATGGKGKEFDPSPIDVPAPTVSGALDGAEEGHLRAVSRKRSILSRRIIASNSWPPTILASSHTTLLISIECISQQILHTPVFAIIAQPLTAVDIMKSLQTLMDRQRRMAVGNAEAEDLLTKLVYVFAPVCRLAERLVSRPHTHVVAAIDNDLQFIWLDNANMTILFTRHSTSNS